MLGLDVSADCSAVIEKGQEELSFQPSKAFAQRLYFNLMDLQMPEATGIDAIVAASWRTGFILTTLGGDARFGRLLHLPSNPLA
jgi:hypothetical protein